jgi:hypothetical protein
MWITTYQTPGVKPITLVYTAHVGSLYTVAFGKYSDPLTFSTSIYIRYLIMTKQTQVFRKNVLHMQRRMRETPQIQVCQACSVIPKKTRGCNCCQRCFNKVLSKGAEYLSKHDISVFCFYKFATISKNLFLFCHYWVLC